jgi:hypothetical protein
MSGPGIQIAESKAPWIAFVTRAVEDRAASIAAGRYVAKDQDYVLITPHGSKDRIEQIAGEWLDTMDQEVRNKRLPEEWAKSYRRAYASWKEGNGIPLEGTPIINWPVVSPAQIELLKSLKVLTVEVLAGANEELIRRLGMGGRALVDKAKDFLQAADGPGKLAQEMEALRQMVVGLKARTETLEEQNQALRQQVRSGQQVGEPQEAFSASDILDEPATPSFKPL